VLGEGNASARIDHATMLVTTSGSQLASLTATDLVEVDLDAALALATGPGGGDAALEPDALAATVRSTSGAHRPVPSIETVLHALVLARTGATFVGHTHPTAVLGLACSDRAAEAFAAPIFPDEVVVCGPAHLVVPYASPGPALAGALDDALARHLGDHGVWPRSIILTNHGLLALGATAAEVLAVTTMVAKSARIRAAALAVGELVPLPAAEVRALSERSDEVRRRRLLIGDD
jgi:rhamnose utilization protein RhaD (predicted bifunctional aldolase and dehydrogenase)